MEIYRQTFAEINLDAISQNLQFIKQIAGSDRFICPMVKANAYGHGDVRVAQFLDQEKIENLGVCLIEEGLLLKNHKIKANVLVFRGFDKIGAEKIIEAQLTPVVSTWEQLKILETLADEPLKIHLKFNTGMNRLGFAPDEVEDLRKYFKQSSKIKLKALLTHFHSGEDALDPAGESFHQFQMMQKISDFFSDLDIFTHIFNSAGLLCFAEAQKKAQHYLKSSQWGFRPGLLLYGYAPELRDNTQKNFPIKPAMTLKSVINNIRSIKKGESVSYGASWRANKDSYIAVVPAGYADGIHRVLSNKGSCLFRGEKVPLVGKICMDFLMLDVSHVVNESNFKSFNEEEVILFGHDQNQNLWSADQVAKDMSSITWEVLTSVGERVPRKYKGGVES